VSRRHAIIFLSAIMLLTFCGVAVADELVPIDAGLATVDKTALATKIKDIFVGIGYFVGVVAVGSLIFNGFRLVAAGDEQKRAQAKTHIMWTLGGVVLVGLALMIVGALYIPTLSRTGHEPRC
jgi:uncharacterized membrane protein